MARPSLTDQQVIEMRARLLAETARLIGREGYAAFSMRRLAASVDMSAGALYRYFPTKRHVLLAYFEDALSTLSARIAATSAAQPIHHLAVRRMMVDYIRFCREDVDRFRLLFLENDLGQFPELLHDTNITLAYRHIRDRVANAIAAGSFRALPLDQATQVLWGAVHGVISLSVSVVELDFGNVDELALTAVDNAIRGLTPSASEN